CRGAYVAGLVSSREAAPEIEHLGAADFLRRRDEIVVADLDRAEDVLHRTRQHDVIFIAVGPLASLGVLALAHPRSASVWMIVAALVAIATFEALVTVRSAVYFAVAVSGGAERLDDLASQSLSGDAAWPLDTTLAFNNVEVASSDLGVRRLSGAIAPRRRV